EIPEERLLATQELGLPVCRPRFEALRPRLHPLGVEQLTTGREYRRELRHAVERHDLEPAGRIQSTLVLRREVGCGSAAPLPPVVWWPHPSSGLRHQLPTGILTRPEIKIFLRASGLT